MAADVLLLNIVLMFYLLLKNNQKGVAHVMLLLAILGLIVFVLITQTFNFKNSKLAQLFTKTFTHAAGVNLTATFNSIGIEVPGNTATSATLRFRKTGDANWRQGLPLWQAGGALYGSVLLTSAGTSYDVEVTPTGGTAMIASVTTRAEINSDPTQADPTKLVPTHCVDGKNGNDTNNGLAVSGSCTGAAAWRTFPKAVTSANAATSDMVIEFAPAYYNAPGSAITNPNNKKITFKAKNMASDNNGNVANASVPGTQNHSVIDTGVVSAPASGKWVQVTPDGIGSHRVFEWAASGISNPQNLGYNSSRELLPIRVGRWDAKAGTMTPAEWATAIYTNSTYSYGFYTSGQDIYLRIPGDIDPNTQYVTIGGGTGVTIGGPNIRVSGFEIRQENPGISLNSNSSFGVVDHNLINGSGSSGGVQFLGSKTTTPSVYGHDHVVQYNRIVDSSLWTSTPWSAGKLGDKFVIPWNFIKGTISGAPAVTSNRYGQANEVTAVYSNGGAHNVVVRYNTFDGSFNGVSGYHQGYDRYAAQDQDIHDNLFLHMADDGLEPESATDSTTGLQSGIINWRIWNNRLQQTFTVLSTGPVFYGPIYLFKNQAWETGQNFNDVWGGSSIFKYSGTSTPAARVYVVNNTFWTDNYNPTTTAGTSGGAQNAGGGSNTEKFYLRNNIIRTERYVWESAPLNTTTGSYLNWDEGNDQFATSDLANSTIANKRGLQYGGPKYTTNVGAYQSSYQTTSGIITTTNVLFNATAGTGHFVDTSLIDNNLNNVLSGGLVVGNLTPKAGAPFADKGVVIPNIADLAGVNYQGFAPDLGACEGNNCLATIGGSAPGSASSPISLSPTPTPSGATGGAVTPTAYFKLVPSVASVSSGSSFVLSLKLRSDVDAANLFSAKLKFDPTKLQVVAVDSTGSIIDTTASGSWVEKGVFDNTQGTIAVTGGVPAPGVKTTTDTQFLDISFNTISAGAISISLDPASLLTSSISPSAIYRNSDNANILDSSKVTPANLTINPASSPSPSITPTPTPSITPTPTPSATPTPTPTPTPSASPSVTPTSSPTPIACSFNSATWSNTGTVAAGSTINLTINGNSGCIGQSASIAVFNDNTPLPATAAITNPVNVTFTSIGSAPNQTSIATGSWVAEYVCDGLLCLADPPEYFLVVTSTTAPSTTITSDPSLELKVNRSNYLAGDGSKDGKVDLTDLSVMFSYWSKTTPNFPIEIDLNSDGLVNTFDYSSMINILKSNGVVR